MVHASRRPLTATDAPDLAAALAVAPTTAVDTTLPLMLRLATARVQFTTEDVIRTCAKRCAHDGGLELAQAVLTLPTTAQALPTTTPRGCSA